MKPEDETKPEKLSEIYMSIIHGWIIGTIFIGIPLLILALLTVILRGVS